MFFFLEFVFPELSTLQLRHKKLEHRILILREISSLDPATEVWKQMSRSKCQIYVLTCVS